LSVEETTRNMSFDECQKVREMLNAFDIHNIVIESEERRSFYATIIADIIGIDGNSHATTLTFSHTDQIDIQNLGTYFIYKINKNKKPYSFIWYGSGTLVLDYNGRRSVIASKVNRDMIMNTCHSHIAKLGFKRVGFTFGHSHVYVFDQDDCTCGQEVRIPYDTFEPYVCGSC